MPKPERPIRITVSTHGGMRREYKNVEFYVPQNMRVAVYTPPYCSLINEGIDLTLKNAHKIYEPGTRMIEMNLMLMHTKNNEERFSVAEKKGFYHYITANGQPLRTEHFPELKRYKTHAFENLPNKIAYRSVTLSQFLSMLLNRYGEERMITIKIIACRSDSSNEFQIKYFPKKKQIKMNMMYWNINKHENNNKKRHRLIQRIKRSGNTENLAFAKMAERQLKNNGIERNRIFKMLSNIFKNDKKGLTRSMEEWKTEFGKRRPANK